jgi:hypothetical protein
MLGSVRTGVDPGKVSEIGISTDEHQGRHVCAYLQDLQDGEEIFLQPVFKIPQ